jgi:hypothetical protein
LDKEKDPQTSVVLRQAPAAVAGMDGLCDISYATIPARNNGIAIRFNKSLLSTQAVIEPSNNLYLSLVVKKVPLLFPFLIAINPSNSKTTSSNTNIRHHFQLKYFANCDVVDAGREPMSMISCKETYL